MSVHNCVILEISIPPEVYLVWSPQDRNHKKYQQTFALKILAFEIPPLGNWSNILRPHIMSDLSFSN